MKNARSHRESREYAQTVIRVVKTTSLRSINSQLLVIYNDLDVKFQRDVFMFTFLIDLNTFLHELDFKKEI